MILATFIAEATAPNSDAVTFWQILQIASFLSGPICSVVMLIMFSRNGKQRREVSFEFEPVALKDFKERMTENTKRHAELFRGIEHAQNEAKQDLKDAEEKLEARIELNYREITEIMRALPSEIVTMLKNTKGLI